VKLKAFSKCRIAVE